LYCTTALNDAKRYSAALSGARLELAQNHFQHQDLAKCESLALLCKA